MTADLFDGRRAEPEDTEGQDHEALRFEPYDWQRSLSASVAAYAERTARRRDERAAMARARNYGLTRRHAEKLARNRREEDKRPGVNG